MRRRRDRDASESFYDAALSAADRAGLAAAREVAGLDEEIALLRLQLRQALESAPEDYRLLQGGVRLLIQALLARHRISPEQAGDLGDTIMSILEQFGDALHGELDA